MTIKRLTRAYQEELATNGAFTNLENIRAMDQSKYKEMICVGMAISFQRGFLYGVALTFTISLILASGGYLLCKL